jgi:hypothetical protein
VDGPCEIPVSTDRFAHSFRQFSAASSYAGRAFAGNCFDPNLPFTGSVFESAIGNKCDSRETPKLHRAKGAKKRKELWTVCRTGERGEAFQVSQLKGKENRGMSD